MDESMKEWIFWPLEPRNANKVQSQSDWYLSPSPNVSHENNNHHLLSIDYTLDTMPGMEQTYLLP